MFGTRKVKLAFVAVMAVTTLAALQAPASAAVYPNANTYAGAITYNVFNPRKNPPGANDWACKPSAAKPRPVVLIHGTFGNMTNAWQGLSPHLKNKGFCVFALDYGAGPVLPYPIMGSNDIRQSAAQIDAFVDRVKAATGAKKVDLVGHSQGGGITPRWYLKYNGGASEVANLVGIAPSNHGTTLNGLGTLARLFGVTKPLSSISPAAEQQVIGSAVNKQLDAGGDTMPGVMYTNIVTKYDQVVTPYSRQYLTGTNVKNVLLQSGCFIDYSEHLGIAYSPRTFDLVTNALDPANARTPRCTLQMVP